MKSCNLDLHISVIGIKSKATHVYFLSKNVYYVNVLCKKKSGKQLDIYIASIIFVPSKQE